MDMQRLLILRGLPEALKAFRSDKDFEGRLVEALRTHLSAGPRDSLYYQDRGTEDGQAFVIYLFNRADPSSSGICQVYPGDECLYRVPYAVTPGGALEFSFGAPQKVRERRDYVPEGEIAKAGPVANRPGLALDPLTHRWKKVGGMHDGDAMLQATDRRNMLAQHLKSAGYNVRHDPGHTGTTYIEHGNKTAAVQTSDDGDGLIATHHHTGDAMDSEWHGIDHHEDMHKFLRGLGHPSEAAKAGPLANAPGLALDPTSHRWKKVSESLVQHHIPTHMNRDALAGALRKKGNAVADDVADDMHSLAKSHGTHEAARYLLHAAYDGPQSKVHEVASHLRYGDYDKAVQTAAGAHSEQPQEYVPPKANGKRPGLTRDKDSGDFTRHAEAPNDAAAAAYEHAVSQDRHGAKVDEWVKKSRDWPRREDGSPVNATAYKKNQRHSDKHGEAWAAHHNAMTGHLHGSAAPGESDHAREKSRHANEWSAANGFGPAEALKAKAKGDNLTLDMFGGGTPAAPKTAATEAAAAQGASAKPTPAGDDEAGATVRKAQELMEVGHPSPFGQSWAAHSKATIDAAHREAFPHKYGAGDPTHGGKLTAQKVTDKAGHQTTRYKKTGEVAPNVTSRRHGDLADIADALGRQAAADGKAGLAKRYGDLGDAHRAAKDAHERGDAEARTKSQHAMDLDTSVSEDARIAKHKDASRDHLAKSAAHDQKAEQYAQEAKRMGVSAPASLTRAAVEHQKAAKAHRSASRARNSAAQAAKWEHSEADMQANLSSREANAMTGVAEFHDEHVARDMKNAPKADTPVKVKDAQAGVEHKIPPAPGSGTVAGVSPTPIDHAAREAFHTERAKAFRKMQAEAKGYGRDGQRSEAAAAADAHEAAAAAHASARKHREIDSPEAKIREATDLAASAEKRAEKHVAPEHWNRPTGHNRQWTAP